MSVDSLLCHLSIPAPLDDFVELADLLPALKGEGSLWAVRRFPSSIRGYICHLRGIQGGQSSPQLD